MDKASERRLEGIQAGMEALQVPLQDMTQALSHIYNNRELNLKSVSAEMKVRNSRSLNI